MRRLERLAGPQPVQLLRPRPPGPRRPAFRQLVHTASHRQGLHPTGPGLCRFVFDFLLEAEGKPSRAFAKESAPILEQAETAINSLSHFDVEQASYFHGHLRDSETGELRTSEWVAEHYSGMTFSELVPLPEGHALYDEPVTVDNLPRAVVESSKWLLRGSRLPQLEALRRGFTRHVRSRR